MALPQPAARFERADFFAWEAEQPMKHDYVAGEVFAQAGARQDHVVVALNIATSLRQKLRGTPCRAYISDMQLEVMQADAVFYPDVFVTCDPRDRQPEASLAKQHPALIIEVLSDSTAAFDRGRKFEHYQQIDTLQEYLLIEQDRKHADLFRKNSEGLWVLHPAGEGDVVRLESVGAALALDGLYEDVEL